MTLHDCAEAFRANQISISEPKLCDGIEAGQFPFAVCLGDGGGSKRTVLIFRSKFYRWLADMLGSQPIEI